MAEKERNQNPVIGDTVTLRIITFNSHNMASLNSVEKVEIYRLDQSLCSASNPDGRELVETINAADVTLDSTGNYSVSLPITAPTYTISKYLDVWHVTFRDGDVVSQYENKFEIYPDLWYISTIPAVYGFEFQFQPNRIRKGSVKYLTIKIQPNVPRATELERYYTNLAIQSNLKISIEQNCGHCPIPEESDLRMIVEDELVTIRDRIFGFYKLDTSEDGLDLDCGIYNVWFTLAYADSIEISPKMQFQVY
jgi:hypothetical protein